MNSDNNTPLLSEKTFYYPMSSNNNNIENEVINILNAKSDNNYKSNEVRDKMKFILDKYYTNKKNISDSLYNEIINEINNNKGIDNQQFTTPPITNQPVFNQPIINQQTINQQVTNKPNDNQLNTHDNMIVPENTILDPNTVNYNKFHSQMIDNQFNNNIQYIIAVVILIIGIIISTIIFYK